MVTSWDLKKSNFASVVTVNKSEQIRKKANTLKDNVSSYRTLQADRIPLKAKSLGVTSQRRKGKTFLIKTLRHYQGYEEAVVEATDVCWSTKGQ